jgi:hypothetical protein
MCSCPDLILLATPLCQAGTHLLVTAPSRVDHKPLISCPRALPTSFLKHTSLRVGAGQEPLGKHDFCFILRWMSLSGFLRALQKTYIQHLLSSHLHIGFTPFHPSFLLPGAIHYLHASLCFASAFVWSAAIPDRAVHTELGRVMEGSFKVRCGLKSQVCHLSATFMGSNFYKSTGLNNTHCFVGLEEQMRAKAVAQMVEFLLSK